MAWLGVNLNDSLSSLKGQLSNFTRDVLSEEFEGEDDDSQVVVPRDRIKELESLCQLQKHELEESKRARAEVEERLQAADIHASHQTKLLRQQLQQYATELNAFKEKHVDWSWDSNDVSNHTSNHNDTTQNHEWVDGLQGLNHQNHHPSGGSSNLELQNQQLSHRVEDLEKELGSLRDLHQEQVALLLDQHRQQLLAVKGQHQEDGVRSSDSPASAVTATMESDDGLPERGPCAKDVAVWEQERMQLEMERDRLNGRVDILQRQVQQLKSKDEEVKELQTKLVSLTDECSQLKNDNEQHIKNLEEIDTQHQIVIDQIMKKKKNMQDELQTRKAAYDQLAEQVAQHESERVNSESEIQRLTSELQSSMESNQQSLDHFKKQLEATSLEKDDLLSQLNDMKEERSTQEEQLKRLSNEKENLEKHMHKQDETRQNVPTEDQTLELERVKNQCLELQNANSSQSSKLETITEELNNLRGSEAKAQELLKASDEKKQIAETEVISLTSQLSSLTDEMSKLTVEGNRKSQQDKMVGEKQQEVLEEKLSVLEGEKKKLEQDVKLANQEKQDAKSQTEILESELQAKVQELEISNERISELQTKFKHAESELAKLKSQKREDHEQLKKILTSHNIEVTSSIVADIHKIAELVKDSVWQRDTLEHHMSSIAQELREKKEQLQEAETTRIDLERECEDLRDQLEEIQKGERPQPEGSSRGLPTIEEESEGCDGEATIEAREQIKVNNNALQQERASQIEALQAQVEALSEARRNLETEVSNMRSDRETLLGQLRESEGRTGNLLNLETEAATLRAERNALEMRLSSLTQQVDLESVTLKDERDTLEEQVTGLEQHIYGLQADMNLHRHERESIGRQLLTQYEIQENREATIRVLEGEIEGLKDKLREKFEVNGPASDALKQLQDKDAKNAEELNGIQSQLIHKEDKIDELTQILEELGKLFDLEIFTPNKAYLHIQNTYRSLQSQLATQKLKIEELEATLQNQRDQNDKNSAQLESDYALKKEESVNDIALLKEKLEKSEMELFQLREKVEEISLESNGKGSEIVKLQEQLKVLQEEKSVAISSLNQSTSELNTLSQEKSQLLEAIVQEKKGKELVQCEKEDLLTNHMAQVSELTKRYQEIVEQFSKLEKDSENALAERDSTIKVLRNQLSQFQNDNSVTDTLASENEKLIEREKSLQNEYDHIFQENKSLQEEKKQLMNENKEALSGKDLISQQYSSLQAERDQMIATITQKHQESVTYHAEIQRLMQVLNQTAQTTAEEKLSLTNQLAEVSSALNDSRAEVTKAREELDGLKRVKDELQKRAADDIIMKTETSGLRKEMEILQGKYTTLEQERDQLRIANAHFNTQYQDQSKELAGIKEREARLSVETERLRQHLVTVEESYTAEAIKAEEREGTLRSTLGKMEEKLNNHSTFYSSASQRASVHVEALQEQLREVSMKRDDAVLRLHAAEEAAEQHQQSLETLQQVLQDFQKGQIREISEATERTRRQLEVEQESNKMLSSEIESLKTQLAEVQGALAAASRLGEQIHKKDQMIVALKAQVTSQEEVAVKARSEVVCLKTSSEGKIEKNLLRNLLVGYFATPADKRQEVLRVIAEVLDFSGEERSRTGIDIQGKSWLSSIANFLAPPASNVQVTSKVDVLDHTSLSQAFIRFLEDESTPRPQARLPAVQMAQKTEEKAEKKAQAKNQAVMKMNPFVSTGEVTNTETNTDSRCSPLLAAASAPPTLPTFTPLSPASSSLSSPNLLEVNPVTPTTMVSASGIATPVSTNKYLTNLLGNDGTAKEDGK